MTRILLLALISLFLGNCTPKVLPADLSLQTVSLILRIDTVIVVEKRSDTLTIPMKLPAIATRHREWKVTPGLSPTLQSELIGLIKGSSIPTGIPCVVTLFIEDAFYKISGDANSVTEFTQFDVSMTFEMDSLDQVLKTTATSNNYFSGAFNATEAHVKKMYRITARNAVHKALVTVKNELSK